MSSPAFANAKPAAEIPPAVSSPEAPPAHVQVVQMATAIWVARAVFAAAKLRLADLLADSPKTADELARATKTHGPSIHRLLRTLASRGLFTEVEPKRFALTPLGATLKSDTPGSARAVVMTLGGDWQWKAWGDFLYSLETGRPAMDKVWGTPLFEYLARHADDAACFGEAMAGIHGAEAAAVVKAYDFSKVNTLVDLGGGTGTLLAAILQANAHLRGVLCDLAHTVPRARKRVEASGLAARCDVVAGDFFDAVPAGHDGYVLSHVLHDWNDEQCMAILRNCRKAIAAGGRLLIVEIVIPAGDTPHHGKQLDLLMLTVTGGIERTAEEFAALLEAAGFRLTRIVSTATPQSIVEAVPA